MFGYVQKCKPRKCLLCHRKSSPPSTRSIRLSEIDKGDGNMQPGNGPTNSPRSGRRAKFKRERERIKALLRDKMNCPVRFGICFLRVQLMFQPCCQGKLVELTVQFILYLSSGMNNPVALAWIFTSLIRSNILISIDVPFQWDQDCPDVEKCWPQGERWFSNVVWKGRKLR